MRYLNARLDASGNLDRQVYYKDIIFTHLCEASLNHSCFQDFNTLASPIYGPRSYYTVLEA